MRPDLEEEVGVVTEAVRHAFDDLDLVVDALDEVGAQRESAMGEDAGQVGLRFAAKRLSGSMRLRLAWAYQFFQARSA
jgi:hypothetical protein